MIHEPKALYVGKQPPKHLDEPDEFISQLARAVSSPCPHHARELFGEKTYMPERDYSWVGVVGREILLP